MKICLYLESYACGGIEAFIKGVAAEADKNAVYVHIAAERIKEEASVPELISCRGMYGFYRLCRKENYDAVHINAYKGTTLKMLAAAYMAGVPVRIAHSHNSDLRPGLLKPLKMILHKAAAFCFIGFATKRLACSAPAAEFMFGNNEYEFIPNGIDIKAFAFDEDIRFVTRKRLGVQKDTILIGCIGRLCAQKNQAFLLEVLSRLGADKKLIIAGEGEDRAFLRRKAVRLKVRDRVLFVGNRTDIRNLMCAMDIFVLPSLFEGLPVTAVEAQAAGLPCIFSDSITQECNIGGLCSFLPLKEHCWRKAIEVCSGRRSREPVSEEFDISRVYRRLERIYAGE